MSRSCRPQALLQQRLRPGKAFFLIGVSFKGSGLKARIRSLNLMPAFPFCPLGASRRKASPVVLRRVSSWHRVSRGHRVATVQLLARRAPASLSPPWGKHLEARETRSPSPFREWGCGESWPSGSSGGTARNGPTPCPGVRTGRAAGSSSARGDRDAGDACGLWLVPRQDSPPCWGMGVEEALSPAEAILRAQKLGFPSHSAKRLPSWWAESSSDSVLAGRGTVQMGNRPWRLAEVLPSLVNALRSHRGADPPSSRLR